jgi:hypothetical protein
MASIAKLKTTGGSGLGEDKEKRVVKRSWAQKKWINLPIAQKTDRLQVSPVKIDLQYHQKQAQHDGGVNE